MAITHIQSEPVGRLGHVLLTGATGMVGGAVLRALLRSDDVDHVTSLGRRPSGLLDPKLNEVEISDFGDRASVARHGVGVDTVFHCLATYSAQVSQEKYRLITVDWLDVLLRAIEDAAPSAQFGLFSAASARPDGRGLSFALRVKGEAENRLFASSLRRKFAFRPAAIVPSIPREQPQFGDHVASLLVPLFPSAGITSNDLVRAMLTTMRRDRRPSAVLENSELRALAGMA